MVSGLLLIDKPSGPTSHDLVYVVRRGAREKKVGHAGTLDPLATGLLIICLGAATRLSEYLLGSDKRYTATVRLGQVTTTYDAEGAVIAESAALPDRTAVEAALGAFRGRLEQRPPAYSAVKVGGKTAYHLARRGEAVALAPRPVDIHALTLVEWRPPECVLDVVCSAGTYVRSLAHDLGQALGCGAHLAALRRTRSGRFEVSEAATLDALKEAFAAGDEAWTPLLLPPDSAVAEWPAVALSAEAARLAQHGQPVPRLSDAPGALARAYNDTGEFVAVLRADPGAGVWRPEKVLFPAAAA